MTQQWCQVTYDLLTVQSCNDLIYPYLFIGVVIGVVATALSVAIYLTWRYH
jgi:hypothetical protein